MQLQVTRFIQAQLHRTKHACVQGVIIYSRVSCFINNIQEIKTKELHNDYLPKHMELFEKRAVKNGTGWIWGDKVRLKNNDRGLLTISVHTCNTVPIHSHCLHISC